MGKGKPVSESSGLRQRAEKLLDDNKPDLQRVQGAMDTRGLVHELQVHQIELEMQNAALSQSRVELESALKRYTDLYNFSPAGYLTLDRNGAIRAANLTSSKMLKIKTAQLIGQPFALFVATDSRPIFSQFLNQLFTTSEATSCELTLTKHDGVPIIVQLASYPSKSGQECQVAIIDITRYRQTEEALFVNKNIYRAIGESINYGIWICAPDGRNIYASQSFLDLVGMTQEQCSGFGWGEALHPDDAEKTIAAWKECTSTAGSWDIEHRYRGVDGQWHDILSRGLPVRNEQGDIICWSGINLDISKFKKTEQALRHSKELLRLFIEYAPAALAMFDSEMRYMHVSNRWLSYYGLTDSYLRGLSHYEVFPETPQELKEAHSRALAGEVISKEEDLHIRADGSELWTRWEIRPWPCHDGTVGGIVIFTEDITERKRAELALRESEERFRAIASASSDWIWEIDVHGRFTYASDMVLHVLGYQPVEVIGRTPFDLMPPDDAERMREQFRIIADRQDSFRDILFINLHRNGEIRYVRATGLPIIDFQGRLIGYRGINKDITERKLYEIALRSSEQRMQQALRVSRSFTFDWQPDSDIVIRSASCGKILDLTGDEAVNDTGKGYFQRIHPEDRAGFVQILNNLSPAAHNYTTEYRIIRADGKEIMLEETGHGTFCGNGTLQRLVGVTTDITARKLAEQGLKRVHDELEQRVRQRTMDLETALLSLRTETAERIKIMDEFQKQEHMLLQQSRLAAMGEMINNIAHQWRQPLNTLGLLIQKLTVYYDTAAFNRTFLEENCVKAMGLIRHMSQTINDFRDFFRSDKEMVLFCPDSIVRQMVAFVDQTFRDLKIKIDVETETGITVQGYPNEFAQALLNIIMNARDALISANTADAVIFLRIFKEGGSSVVTITDNAGGIPEEIIEKVFDPYFTTKGPDKGTGLGLFMSKTIIEKNMAGRLTARNTGTGAEFRIEVKHDRAR